MVLLSAWNTLSLPLVILIAFAKLFLGCFALVVKRWLSMDLIDRTSVKKMKCSLEGLFEKDSVMGELTEENLHFFSKIVVDFHNRKHKATSCGGGMEKPIVKSFNLDKSAINYLADINFFVEIQYDLDHPWVKQVNAQNLPQSVFVKSLPRRIKGRIGQVLLSIHECEAIQFTEVFSTQEWFPSDIMPQVIFANYNYFTTDYLIITEDLRGKYYFRGYSPKTITKEEKFKTVETIAKLHASGMAYFRSLTEKERHYKIDQLDRKSPVFYRNFQTPPDLIMLLIHKFAAGKMVDNDIHPEIIELAKQFFQSSRLNAKLKLCEGAEEMLSFVHRDLHFNNIGIAHEIVNGEDNVSVKLVDWQCCGLGNPLFDVFYMICFTSTLETVESVEEEYLQNYYTCICKELEQRGLSKPKQLENYENYMEFYKDAMFSFLIWCLAIQLIATQNKDKNTEIGITARHFLQSGAHLLLKYGDLKKRIHKILNQ